MALTSRQAIISHNTAPCCFLQYEIGWNSFIRGSEDDTSLTERPFDNRKVAALSEDKNTIMKTRNATEHIITQNIADKRNSLVSLVTYVFLETISPEYRCRKHCNCDLPSFW
ncbi:hypothetical protein CAY59_26870 (plasmid) [Vibrio campbellii]|nr:hypothetical protein CAY59_26870 [Vibrio campbellii]